MKKHIIFIVALTMAFIGAIGFLSRDKYVNSLEEFDNSGYILVANESGDSDYLNTQRYFSSGTTYQKTYDEKIVFTDINSNKVSVDTKNFVHYENESLFCLSDSVLLDTDSIDDTQISYFQITPKSVLEKAGKQYMTNNAGEPVSFDNFVWKMSSERYMVVSDSIILVVSENAQQSFTNYIEVQYIDDGIVHLVNHDGTYSTISSDAYLLLDNGIRIYLGSKNVSDGEGILMNLTQMVVDSDDNVEIIPDVDYNNENVEKPQIIVNATDGENGKDGTDGDDGEAGVIGENGTLGTNGSGGTNGGDGELGDAGPAGDAGANGYTGNRGQAGQSGMEGSNGPDATPLDHADFVFNEETMPKFTIKDDEMNETFNSINPIILYDDNGCTIKDEEASVNYLIFDSETSEIVWKTTLNGNRDLSSASTGNTLNPEGVPVSVLKAKHKYSLLITANYSSNLMNSDEYITQTVFAKTFVTKDTGISLDFAHGTDNSLTYSLDLNKDIANSVKKIRLYLFDKDKEMLIYDINTKDYDIEITDNRNGLSTPLTFEQYGIVSIPSNIDDNVSVNITFTNSDNGKILSDSIYYAKYKIIEYHDGSAVADLGENEYVKGVTLKRTPAIGKPTLKTNPEASSLVVVPGLVTDIDSSITKFRYEFFEVNADGSYSTDPVYTVTKYSTDSFSVVIDKEYAEGAKSDNGMWKDRNYVVRTVGIVDNNEALVDVFSKFSNEASLKGTSPLPACRISINKYNGGANQGKTFASLVDGYIEITNYNNAIDRNGIVTIRVESFDDVAHYYDVDTNTSYSSPFSKKIKISKAYRLDTELIDDEYNNGTFKIPFYMTGLLQDKTYQISVVVNEVEYNNAIITNKELNADTFTTAKYNPIYVSAIDLINADNTTNSFDFDLFFHLDEDAYLEEKTNYVKFEDKTATMIGSANSYDLTIKSATAVSLDIYPGDSLGTSPSNAVDAKLNKEPLVIKSSAITNLTGHNLAAYYTFVTDYYNKGYLTEEAWDTYKTSNVVKLPDQPNNFVVHVTDKSFENDETLMTKLSNYLNAHPNAYLFVKVNNLYDYTYGLGGSQSQLYTTPFVNKIQIGQIVDTYDVNDANTYLDQWVYVKAKYARPAWNGGPNYYTITELFNNPLDVRYKEYIYDTTTGIPTSYVTNLNDSAMTLDGIRDYWTDNKIVLNTCVGYVIQGDNNWLGSYGSAVRYTILDESGKEVTKSYNDNTNGGNEGWIPYEMGEELPKYVFFMDVPANSSAANADNKISRGEKFTVKMEIKLKNFGDEIYPTDSAEQHKVNDVPFDHNVSNGYDIISNDYIIAKQKPEVLMLDYKGVKGSSGDEDEYLVSINDPDEALEYVTESNKKKAVIYKNETDTIKLDVSSKTTIASTYPAGYYVLKTHVPESGKLYTKWNNGVPVGFNGNAKNPVEQISLIEENGIKEGHNLTVLDMTDTALNPEDGITNDVRTALANDSVIITDSSSTFYNENKFGGRGVYVIPDIENQVFNVYVAVRADSTTDDAIKESILDYSITFTNNIDSSKTITCKMSDKNGCLFTNKDVHVSSVNEGTNYYVLRLGQDISWASFSSILNQEQSTTFNVSLSLQYDTGNYGTYYVSNGYYHYDKKVSDTTTTSFKENTVYSTTAVDYSEIDTVKWANNSFKLNEYGLKLVPKEVASAYNDYTFIDSDGRTLTWVTIEKVLPKAIVDATSVGLYYAKLDIKLSGYGTLLLDKGLKLEYRVRGSGNDWEVYKEKSGVHDQTSGTEKVFDLNALSFDVLLRDLTPAKEYEFRVVGYTKGSNGDPVAHYLNPQSLAVPDQNYIVRENGNNQLYITTLSEILISDTETYFEPFVMESKDTRVTKGIRIGLRLKETTPYDVNKAINEIVLTVNQNTATGPQVGTYTIPGTKVYAQMIANAANDFDKKDYVVVIDKIAKSGSTDEFNALIPFEPVAKDTSDIKLHSMDDNTNYVLSIVEKYKPDDAHDDYEISSIFNHWKFDNNTNRVRIQGSNGAIGEELIKFNIAIKDDNRIFVGKNETSIRYIAELHWQHLSDDGSKLIDEIVDFKNTDAKTVLYQKQAVDSANNPVFVTNADGQFVLDANDQKIPVYTGVTDVNGDGNVDESDIKLIKVMIMDTPDDVKGNLFSGSSDSYNIKSMNPAKGSQYYVKLYLVADTQNDLVDSTMTYAYVADYDNFGNYFIDHYNEFKGNYTSNKLVVKSSIIKTASSVDPEVLGMVPNFKENMISFVGLNLDTVSKISVTIEDLTSGKVYSFDVSAQNGSEWTLVSGNYKLAIPSDLNLDLNNHFYLTTALYKDASSTTPDTIVELNVEHNGL